MPVSRTVTLVGGLEATVTPQVASHDDDLTPVKRIIRTEQLRQTPGKKGDGSRTIYFTDENPTFTVELTNKTEYDFVEDSKISWYIAIGEGMPKPVYQGNIDINIPQGTSRKYQFGGELLAFEGHGVVGLDSGGHSGRSDSTERVLKSGSGASYSPAYTFSVWDRDHYQVIHEQPKKIMELSSDISMIIAFMAIVQVLFIVSQLMGVI